MSRPDLRVCIRVDRGLTFDIVKEQLESAGVALASDETFVRAVLKRARYDKAEVDYLARPAFGAEPLPDLPASVSTGSDYTTHQVSYEHSVELETETGNVKAWFAAFL
jgi:hypothetical protein